MLSFGLRGAGFRETRVLGGDSIFNEAAAPFLRG